MTDPAIEAAQRASGHLDWRNPNEQQRALLIVGAREALKPIREKCREISSSPVFYALSAADVLRELAPLIYSAEELER